MWPQLFEEFGSFGFHLYTELVQEDQDWSRPRRNGRSLTWRRRAYLALRTENRARPTAKAVLGRSGVPREWSTISRWLTKFDTRWAETQAQSAAPSGSTPASTAPASTAPVADVPAEPSSEAGPDAQGLRGDQEHLRADGTLASV